MLDQKAETFLCVCNEMNFTKAAAVLHITQPAVTQQIHALEEYYGVPLFSFSGKKFVLTVYGEMIRSSLSSMHSNGKYLCEHILAVKDRREIINMGATLTVSEYMMSDYLSSYLCAHPSADISMATANTGELLTRLDKGQIDFAVLEGNYSGSLYSHRCIINADFIGIISGDPKYALPAQTAASQSLSRKVRSDSMLSLSDLTDTRLLLREPGSGTRDIFENALSAAGLSVGDFSYVTAIGDMRAIIELVKSGCGITFLYERAVRDMLRDGCIRKLPVQGFPIKHEISAVWRKDNLQGKYIEGLIGELFSA